MKRGGGKIPPPDSGGTGPSPYVGVGPPPPPQASSAAAPPLGTERDRPLDLSAYLEPGLRDGMLEEKKRRNKRRDPWFYMPTVPAFKWLQQYQPKKDLFWDLQVRPSAASGGEEGMKEGRKKGSTGV